MIQLDDDSTFEELFNKIIIIILLPQKKDQGENEYLFS